LDLGCGVGKGPVFGLGARVGDCVLFLGALGDEIVPKKDAISASGATVSRVASLISIGVSMEVSR